MKIRYVFSSPQGDIEANSNILSLPLKLSLEEEHKWIKLKDYFDIIFHFIEKRLDLADVKEIIIRSEKYGRFYNVASVELKEKAKNKRYAVLFAIGKFAKKLEKEFYLTRQLRQRRRYSKEYLTKYYFLDQIEINKEKISLIIAEWLDGYYEWHITEDGNICVWDTKKGYYLLKSSACYDLYKKCAFLLTYFFDPNTYCQIYPWHHSAGDFVLKEGRIINVKLTTVRNYEPVFSTTDNTFPYLGLVYFLLNMSMKMRLDKKDGTGQVLIAPKIFVKYTIEGFIEGLKALVSEGLLSKKQKDDLIRILKLFNKNELLLLFYSMLEHYNQEDPLDIPVILQNAEDHINYLYHCLQTHLP